MTPSAFTWKCENIIKIWQSSIHLTKFRVSSLKPRVSWSCQAKNIHSFSCFLFATWPWPWSNWILNQMLRVWYNLIEPYNIAKKKEHDLMNWEEHVCKTNFLEYNDPNTKPWKNTLKKKTLYLFEILLIHVVNMCFSYVYIG